MDRRNIEATWAVIQPWVRVTPVVEVGGADFGLDGITLVLKLEHLQHSGSFKTRGAFANLLMREIPEAGVVAASGGNHGAAVAYAAMRRGVRAKIFVPTVASPAKIQRIREYGAELVISGERYADALAASTVWAAQSGALPIHAFDQPETLLGQGTIGMELARQAPDLDSVLVAVGGGGLTGGIAADSLAPRQVGQVMFPIAQAWVDHVVLVSDDAIRRAQDALWTALRLVAEPGGAAALAGLLSGGHAPSPGVRIGVLISGGNTTAVDFNGPGRRER